MFFSCTPLVTMSLILVSSVELMVVIVLADRGNGKTKVPHCRFNSVIAIKRILTVTYITY